MTNERLGANIFMGIDLLKLLQSNAIFSSLKTVALKNLLKKFVRVRLAKNKFLFHQSGTSNSLYFLLSGHLKVILKRPNKAEQVIYEVMPGETVGEAGALSGEPRTATVKAVEDCVLLKLSSQDFIQCCKRHPAMIFACTHHLIARSQNLMRLISIDEPAKKHIIVIAAHKNISLKKMTEKISASIKDIPSTLMLSDDQDALLPTDEMIFDKNMIFYFIKSFESPLAKVFFENPDKVYIVGDADKKPNISRNILSTLKDLSLSVYQVELIMLHEQPKDIPKDTDRWLKMLSFGLVHHIRVDEDEDIKRIVRCMLGRAIGLVLGGGGLRCWAHLGAIRALHELGIPIDIIGGTSAGAIVAGHYAMGKSDQIKYITELQELSEITRDTVSLKNLSWPSASLFTGNDYTEKLRAIFGQTRLEDLWIPCFCMMSNLASNKQVVCRSGYLWKMIRASTSVPAIFPPVVINGKLNLDGGILNNLPVDVMRKLIGPQGTVIAVELTHYNEDITEYHYPPILSFWQVMLSKLGIAYHEYKFPHFIDTFLKALLAGSSAKQQENSLSADILVSPDLAKFRMLAVRKADEETLIQLGHDATILAVSRWKDKKNN